MSSARILNSLLERILEKLIGRCDNAVIEEAKEVPVPPVKWDGIYDAEDLPLMQGEKSEGMSFKM